MVDPYPVPKPGLGKIFICQARPGKFRSQVQLGNEEKKAGGAALSRPTVLQFSAVCSAQAKACGYIFKARRAVREPPLQDLPGKRPQWRARRPAPPSQAGSLRYQKKGRSEDLPQVIRLTPRLPGFQAGCAPSNWPGSWGSGASAGCSTEPMILSISWLSRVSLSKRPWARPSS